MHLSSHVNVNLVLIDWVSFIDLFHQSHLMKIRMISLNAKDIKIVCVCVSRSVVFNSLWLYCNPPGSFVHGILQARIVEWIAISFSKKANEIKTSKTKQNKNAPWHLCLCQILSWGVSDGMAAMKRAAFCFVIFLWIIA